MSKKCTIYYQESDPKENEGIELSDGDLWMKSSTQETCKHEGGEWLPVFVHLGDLA